MTNSAKLHAAIDEPWVVSATDDDVEQFVRRRNFRYKDARDHLLCNFNNVHDLQLFWHHMNNSNVLVNVCLFGSDYLINNLNMECNA